MGNKVVGVAVSGLLMAAVFVAVGPALAHKTTCVETVSVTFIDPDLEMWAQQDTAHAEADDYSDSITADCADVTVISDWEDKGGHTDVVCAHWESQIELDDWTFERTVSLSGQDGEVEDQHIMPVATTHDYNTRTTLWATYNDFKDECEDQHSRDTGDGSAQISLGDTN